MIYNIVINYKFIKLQLFKFNNIAIFYKYF